MRDVSRRKPSMTVGIDLGDKYSYLCVLDTESGEVIEEGRLRTTPEALERRFCAEQRPLRIAIESGTPTRLARAGYSRSALTRSWWPTLAGRGSSTLEQAQDRRGRCREPGPPGARRSQTALPS
jgi:hypothetical protein